MDILGYFLRNVLLLFCGEPGCISILPVWLCRWHCACGLWPLGRWWFSQRTEGRGTSSHCWPLRSWVWWGGSCWWCCTCWGLSQRWSRAGWIWSDWAALRERRRQRDDVIQNCHIFIAVGLLLMWIVDIRERSSVHFVIVVTWVVSMEQLVLLEWVQPQHNTTGTEIETLQPLIDPSRVNRPFKVSH